MNLLKDTGIIEDRAYDAVGYIVVPTETPDTYMTNSGELFTEEQADQVLEHFAVEGAVGAFNKIKVHLTQNKKLEILDSKLVVNAKES